MVVGSWQGVFVPEGHAASRSSTSSSRSAHETMKHPEVVKRLTESGVTHRHQQVARRSSAKFWEAENRALRQGHQGREHRDRMSPDDNTARVSATNPRTQQSLNQH